MFVDPTALTFEGTTAITAFTRHGKKYPDGSDVFTMKLEAPEHLRRPLHLKLVTHHDELVLFQEIEAIPPTQKLPAVHIEEVLEEREEQYLA